jgi:phosphoglycolate phosphatase
VPKLKSASSPSTRSAGQAMRDLSSQPAHSVGTAGHARRAPSKPVRLVLFDIDGTLIHTHGVGVQAFGRTLEFEFQCPDVSHRVRFGGRTDPSLVREVFHHADIEHSEQNVTRFFESYIFWLDHLLTESGRGGPCAGVHGFLEGLRSLSEPPAIGLLTGNIRLGAEIKLRHFGLWEPFVMGAFGDDHEDRNQIAAIAMERGRALLGAALHPEEVLVIGDTPRDVECGRAIGAKVLAVATGGAKEDELRASKPDWLVTTLEGADVQSICC